jgi:hypothetical protein
MRHVTALLAASLLLTLLACDAASSDEDSILGFWEAEDSRLGYLDVAESGITRFNYSDRRGCYLYETIPILDVDGNEYEVRNSNDERFTIEMEVVDGNLEFTFPGEGTELTTIYERTDDDPSDLDRCS